MITLGRIRQSPCERKISTDTIQGLDKYALDSQRQLLLQRRVVPVRWQIDTVEARMRLRQLARVAGFLDGETARSVGSLQILEAVDRDTRRARGKLQEARFALRWPASDALPEPLDDFVVDFVSAVVRELGPIVAVTRPSARARAGQNDHLHIDFGHTTDEQLELPLVKDVDQVLRDELAEARHESVKLLLDTS